MGKLLNSLLAFSFLTAPLISENNPILTYKIKTETNWEKNYSFKYLKLKAENFPTNVSLNYELKKLDKSIGDRKKVKIDAQGRIIELASGKEWHVVFGNFLKGEPIFITVSSDDQLLSRSVTIVPRPIQVKDQSGHTLSLVLLCKEGEFFQLDATGFEPFEKLDFISKSENEILAHPIEASADGTITSIIEPGVIGRAGGKASLELKGKTTSNLKVNYKWGIFMFEERNRSEKKNLKKQGSKAI
jgi:hypothetical protein